MKKILFVMYDMTSGGAEKSLVNLLNELNPDEFEISLLLFNRKGIYLHQIPSYVKMIKAPYALTGLFNNTDLKQVRYYPVYLYKIATNLLTKLLCKEKKEQMYFRWKKYYSRIVPELTERFDVACAYTSGTLTYYVADKVQYADRKISWNHNDYNSAGYSTKADDYYFRKFDYIVTISDQCEKALLENLPQFADKYRVIPNLTSSAVIKSRAKEFYPPEYCSEGVRIISIGRLCEQKNFKLLLETAKVLKGKKLRFHWYVLGVGPQEKELKEMAVRLGVQDAVQFLGQRENPYPYMENADLVVQTSIFEGKSIVLDEAKILAKPIVSTNYPTVRDQIVDSREGIIAEMTPDNVAGAIMRMIRDNPYRDSIAEYLKNHEYGNQQEVVQYTSLFNQ